MHDTRGEFLIAITSKDDRKVFACTMERGDYAGTFPNHAEVVSKLANEFEIGGL
jgi:hypothetical protein